MPAAPSTSTCLPHSNGVRHRSLHRVSSHRLSAMESQGMATDGTDPIESDRPVGAGATLSPRTRRTLASNGPRTRPESLRTVRSRGAPPACPGRDGGGATCSSRLAVSGPAWTRPEIVDLEEEGPWETSTVHNTTKEKGHEQTCDR